MKFTAILLSSLLVALQLAAAPAAHAHPTERADSPKPARPNTPHHFFLSNGFRGNVITDGGYDPYDADDYLAQASFGATFVPWSIGKLRFGIAAQYDVGEASADARGVPTSAVLHRIAMGPQAQWQPWERLQLYTRVTAGAVYVDAHIEESVPLTSGSWTWSVEPNLGAAIRLGSAGRDADTIFWINAEVGYVFAGHAAMDFGPNLPDDDPRQVGTMQLPDIQPGGFSHRLAFAVSF